MPDTGRLLLARLAVFDALTGALTPVSLPAAFVSDGGLLAETRGDAPRPPLRGRGERAGLGGGRPRDPAPTTRRSLRALGMPCRARRRSPARGVRHRRRRARPDRGPGGPRRTRGGRRARTHAGSTSAAEGPGLLVVAGGLGPRLVRRQWTTRARAIVRVNHAEMAVALGPGIHRVVLSYRAPGLVSGAILAALGAHRARRRARARGARRGRG